MVNILDVVIVSVSCLAAFFDFKERRIPNWLICIGLLFGIILSAFQGGDYLLRSVAGFVLAVGVLFLPFALGWIGAGDVKYFGVVGALLGVGMLPRVFFYSALAAGLITCGYLMIGAVQTAKLRDQWAGVKTAIISMGHILPEPVSITTQGNRGSVPWGVAFAAGTILAYYVDRDGRFAGF
jgi:prepilin peptidase CpaA